MKSNIQKIVLPTILVLIVVGTYFAIKFQIKQKPVTQTQIPLASPNVDSIYDGENKLTFSVDIDPFEIPKELSTIDIIPSVPMSEDTIFKIASEFNIEKDYISFTNGDKHKIYFFRKGATSLSVNSTANSIAYRAPYNDKVVNKNMSDDEIVAIARGFLIDYGLLNENSLNFSFISYLKNSFENTQQVSKEMADLFKVNFSDVQTGYKLISVNPDQSPISVWVTADGSVAKAEVSLFRKVKLSDTKYALKTFEELKSNIKSAKIIGINKYQSLYNLNSISVSEVEIAYLAESNTSIKYQPIFLIHAYANKESSGDKISVTLYLSALK